MDPAVLADQPVGRWVVLDPKMTQILGTADTPEEALREAGVTNVRSTSKERPVIIQVPDPHLTCLY
jgi:hypothetical protein